MRWTNTFGLPEEIVLEAEKNSGQPRGVDFSAKRVRVTSLIRPPQISILEAAHWNEIERDVSTIIPAMIGTGFHAIMERHSTWSKKEVSLSAEVDGWTITGTADMISRDGMITDWKTCKAYKILKGDFSDWQEQINIYAFLAEENGYAVSAGQVWAVIKDAPASDPPMIHVPITIWPMSDIKMQISEHLKDLHGRPCTDTERWARGGNFAIMQQGKTRAVKLHETEDAATEHASNIKGGFVERRKKRFIRCENFCNVSQFCQQFSKS